MSGESGETRDLLAERIRRLEARIAELGGEIGSTRLQLERATAHLDALVDLVGRLGRVVDVQGTALHGEETKLERKVDSIERSVARLGDGLAGVLERLAAISEKIAGPRAAGRSSRASDLRTGRTIPAPAKTRK